MRRLVTLALVAACSTPDSEIPAKTAPPAPQTSGSAESPVGIPPPPPGIPGQPVPPPPRPCVTLFQEHFDAAPAAWTPSVSGPSASVVVSGGRLVASVDGYDGGDRASAVLSRTMPLAANINDLRLGMSLGFSGPLNGFDADVGCVMALGAAESSPAAPLTFVVQADGGMKSRFLSGSQFPLLAALGAGPYSLSSDLVSGGPAWNPIGYRIDTSSLSSNRTFVDVNMYPWTNGADVLRVECGIRSIRTAPSHVAASDTPSFSVIIDDVSLLDCSP